MSQQKKHEHVGRTIDETIRIEVAPDAVYSAWADPAGIAQWFCDAADGKAEAGKVMTWHFDEFDYHVPVPVVEATPGECIAFAGEIPGRPPFLQQVILKQEGGSTTLRLLNSGFGEGVEWDREYEGVESGWAMALATLKEWLERYRDGGGARTHVLAYRPTHFDFADAQPWFTTAKGLEGWLAKKAECEFDPLDVDSRLTLELAGETLDGRVLARTRTEMLVSWPQRNAVLGFKCFTKPGDGTCLSLDFNAWPLEGERAALRADLDAALERLAKRIEG